jgi:hypothetical protein
MLNQNRVDLGIAEQVMLSEMGYYVAEMAWYDPRAEASVSQPNSSP